MDPFRILLADDHPIFRLGMRSVVESHESWEVCGEAGDGREAVIAHEWPWLRGVR